MLDLIKRKLSLKVALSLQFITFPPMIAAALLMTSQQTANLEDVMVNSARTAARTGARMYGAALEAGIDGGFITLNDAFDTNYDEIKGFDFGENPRFHTKYDFYTDRAVLGFQDAILESSPDFLYAVGGDMNGYTPTHNSKFEQPLTGDHTKDLAGNRAKRKFWTPMHQKAAKNVEPTLVQPYVRDTGESAWDVSSPIYVKGRHFGAFRVALSRDAITAHKRTLLIQLFGMLGVLGAITTGFIFIAIWRSMKPLERLTALADEISSGEKLDQPIKATTTDEIGQMAKSLNRLRSSLQAAMARLGE